MSYFFKIAQKLRKSSRHSKTMNLIDATTNRNIRSVREKLSFNRRMCIRFESSKICVVVNDLDFHNAEHKELPVIKISSDEGRLRRLSTILKPKGTQASLGTTDSGNNSSYSANFV